VSEGWVYEVTQADVIWMARVLECEVGDYRDAEVDATAWTLIQRFAVTRRNGTYERLAPFLMTYSTCARRGPLLDRLSGAADRPPIPWSMLPRWAREYATSFLRGSVPNRFPGWTRFWAKGYAPRDVGTMLGPYYVTTGARGQAYFADTGACRSPRVSIVSDVPALGVIRDAASKWVRARVDGWRLEMP